MTVKFKTVITKAGAEKLAAATVPNGKKVNFTAMAVGDGGGQLPTPNATQTKLVNEVWRHALNKISQDHKNKNYVIAELLIPPETGGFWMREMGLYDDAGTLIAVGNMAESYKPTLAEGSGRAQTVRMVIMVSDINTVELTIDTTTVMASQDYVDDKLAEHEQSRRHPDATLTAKGFTQLSSATDSASEVLAATPKAVKAAYDLANAASKAAKAADDNAGTRLLKSNSLSDVPDKAKARTALELKSAAQADLTSSRYDITAGHALQVGDYGLGTSTGLTFLKSIFDITCTAKYAALGVGAGSGATQGMPANSANTRFSVDVESIYPGEYWVTLKSSGQTYTGLVKTSAKTVAWTQHYTETNKPSSSDVNAVNKGGDTMSGTLKVGAEIQTTSANSFRSVYGSYGTFWRNDGVRLYLMLTNQNDSFGSYNSLRPFWVDLVNGNVTLGKDVYIGGKLTLADYSAFDARYYLKSQSDSGFMPRTLAYTKTESDARYNLKNTASKAANGWEKDTSTGVIKQWGIATRSANSTRITFPTAFPNACTSVQLTLIWENSFHDQNIYVQNPDKSGFTYVAGSGEVRAYFEARGY